MSGFFSRLLLDALYPDGAVCISCGAYHTYRKTPLCEKCQRKLYPLEGPFCPHCGRPGWAMLCPECQNTALDVFSCVRSGFYYQDTGGALVRAFKYSGIRSAIPPLISRMLKNFPEGHYHALVPVPLHPRRERERGFNQSEILCRALSGKTGLPVWHALSRVRFTHAQARLSGAARKQNIRNAFSIAMDVKNCSLILVDDVITTGSTAAACARVLLDAGAHEVALLCAARADLKPKQ